MAPAATTIDDKTARIAAYANRGREKKTVESFAPADENRLTTEQCRAWTDDGFFLLRTAVPLDVCEEIDSFVLETVRRMDREGHRLDAALVSAGSFTVPEENFPARVQLPEDKVSKLYNLHRKDRFRHLARRDDLGRIMAGLLGPDVDVFNSQYIFKNPGAWGQPWHQDSLYFAFDRFPQVGLWLATSRATVENGCLFVLPGSHREPLHEHLPDSRPGANLGYLEIRDQDFARETAIPMEPGDVLVFHSFLMHRSADNASSERRTALVYHYGAAGTRHTGLPSPTVDWMPVVRKGALVAPGTYRPWDEWRTQTRLGIGLGLYRIQKLVERIRS